MLRSSQHYPIAVVFLLRAASRLLKMCRPMAKIGTYRTALFVAVFLLIAITVFWLQLSNQINVKEWQILIGFGGTLFVGWIAWENVDRQLKVQRAANRMTVLFVRRIGRSGIAGPSSYRAYVCRTLLLRKTGPRIQRRQQYFEEDPDRSRHNGYDKREIEKQIALLLPGSDVPTRVTFAHGDNDSSPWRV